jgi:hypothetical protein
LRTIGDQRRGIDIDDGAVAQTQAWEELLAQAVVSGHQTAQLAVTKTPEKTSHRVAVGEFGQPQKRRDQTVVNQRLSILDTSDPRHDSKQVSQKKIDWVITSRTVARPTHLMLQEVPKVERFAKLPKKNQASVPRQACGFEEKMKFSGAFPHFPKPCQNGRILESPIYTQ